MQNSQKMIKDITEEIVTRKRSFDFQNFGRFLPDPDSVLKVKGKDIRIYKELLCEPHVWACVQSRKSGVLSLEWEINRGKDKNQQAQVIEDIFKAIDIYALMSEILNATLFGFQPLEIIWQKQGNLIVPAEIKAKPQEWFCFDDDNKLKFRTKENYYGEDLPEKKFLCPQSNPSYQNPYGERTLSRVFWPVAFKKGGMKFWVAFTEKYGMPFLIGKYPRGATGENKENLADMLEKMVQDAIGIVPDDSRVEIVEAAKSSSADIYEKLIDKMNAEISKAILGQTLTTEIGSTGSYAASNTHMSVRKDIVDSDKKLVEKTLNQLIKWIYEINFNSQDIPTFEMYEEEDVDLTLSQRDKALCESGVKFTKEYFKKTYGFDDEDFEVTQDIKNTKPTFKEFREEKNEFLDQVAIDNFIQSFSDGELQKQAESILQPVLKIIDDCNSYDEIYERLSEKGLNTNQIEKILQKVLFISEAWGRTNGDT
jgi:phage gp29-like protein